MKDSDKLKQKIVQSDTEKQIAEENIENPLCTVHAMKILKNKSFSIYWCRCSF